jgi:hypothetical protein
MTMTSSWGSREIVFIPFWNFEKERDLKKNLSSYTQIHKNNMIFPSVESRSSREKEEMRNQRT